MEKNRGGTGIPKLHHKLICQLKKLCWSTFILIFSSTNLLSEGSVDFINFEGFRLFYAADQEQQLKVFVNPGEFINVGTSHLGISGGTISIYRPDGSLFITYDDMTAAQGIAVIDNDVEEFNGPTGGGTTMGMGYIPGVVPVGADEGGIWSITFDFPSPINIAFTNVMNGEPWTREDDQPTLQRGVLAWDVTVSQGAAANEGGTLLKGRLYSNKFISVVARNGNTTSPKYYVLTKDGFQYQVCFEDTDPYNFPLFSSTGGILTGNYAPAYQSVAWTDIIRTDDPSNWSPDSLYLYQPQAEDTDFIINNKVFFNPPDPNMPSLSTTTDIYRNNTYSTWLYRGAPQVELNISPFVFTGSNALDPPCDNGTNQGDNAGYLVFNGSLGGTAMLSLDLNNDGDFDDEVDRTIIDFAASDGDSIAWDGLDGQGNLVAIPDGYVLNYRLNIRGGEMHILMEDIENNLGGVTFQLLNGDENIQHNNEFYYDHTPIGGPVSGGGEPGNALPTTEPFTYMNNFGNEVIQDYWTFLNYGTTGSATFNFDEIFDCSTPNEDADEDGILNVVDIDDDNDGVPDVLEYCSADGSFDCLPAGLDPSEDADGDDIPNYLDADDAAFDLGCTDDDGDGQCDSVLAIFDVDSDGVPNHLDLDSDNDGILDLVEAGHQQADANGDGVIDGEAADFGQNGFYNPIASDPDAADAVANYTPWDKDGDGVEDYHDLDSDNDGIHDVEEAAYGSSDTDNDGRINPNTVNSQGLTAIIDPAITMLPVPLPPDTDSDGVPDWHDLDSDNDRIHDVKEAFFTGNESFIDINNDGIIGGDGLQVDENGLAIMDASGLTFNTTSSPRQTDGDGIPDYHDLDTDNDGINDVAETGIAMDMDNDGIISTGAPTVDEDGRAVDENGDFITISFPKDQDQDGYADFRDLDSDNDGINDTVEGDHPDPDGDGIIGTGEPQVDDTGRATADANDNPLTTNSSPPDTDGDSFPDYNDLDSDNDGINDTREADRPDEDGDGIIGTGIPIVNGNGQAREDEEGSPLATTSNPADTDGDDLPDFRDLDSDSDGISDVVEANFEDPDNNGMVGTGIPEVNEHGQATGDNTPTSDPTDTDGDLIPDFRELDSDDDGILDEDECPDDNPCVDGDGDGMFDFQDVDRDNDGILDEDECPTGAPCVDTDEDGDADVDDLDSDNGGISDMEECPNGAPCPDNDDNGIPDVIEVNCFESGEAPSIIDLTSNSPVCEGEAIILSATNGNDSIQGDLTYIWEGPNDFMFTETIAANATSVATLSGASAIDSGIYTLNITGGDCDALPASIEVVVNSTPATPTLTTESNLECPTEDVVLTTDTYEGEVNYEWYLNGELLATTEVPTLTITGEGLMQTGTYTVVVSLNGCASAASSGINLVGGMTPVIADISAPNAVCEGDDITLTATNSNDAINGDLTYVWTGPNNFMFTETIAADATSIVSLSEVSTINSGIYTLNVSGGDCDARPVFIEINVGTIPSTPSLNTDSNLECPTESIVFTSDTYAEAVSYEWYLDGELLATTDVPTLTITGEGLTQTGTYTVIVSLNGCASEPSNGIDVAASLLPIIADISATDPACEGNDIILSANNSNPTSGDITYTWEGPNDFIFTENAAATGSFPATLSGATIMDSGTYTLTLVNDSGCTSLPASIDILVMASPATPNISAESEEVCPGETIVLNTDTYEGDVSYEWFFDAGDGNVVAVGTTTEASLSLPNATPEQSGAYAVTVSVNGCTATSTSVNIVVTTGSTTPSINAENEQICEGETIVLNTDAYEGEVSYEWFFDAGDGNVVAVSTTTEPSLSFPNATPEQSGAYSVIASVNACSFSSTSVDVSITADPATPSISAEEEQLCETETIVLNTDAYEGEVSYEWFFDPGDGNLISIETTTMPSLTLVNVAPELSGTYSVIAIVNGCPSASSNDVSIEVLPTPDAVQISNNTSEDAPACIDEDVQLTAPVVANGSYEWSGPNGFTSDIANPVITDVNAADAGAYTLLLSQNACPAVASDPTTVYVFEAITPVIGGAGTFCENESVSINVLNDLQLPVGATVSYEWFDENGNPVAVTNEAGLTFDPATTANTATYSVEVVIGDCRSAASNAIDVNIQAIPDEVAQIIGEDLEVCQASSLSLSAVAASESDGMWTSPSGATVLNPNSAETGVADLQIGENTFVWTLSDEVCGDFSSEMVVLTLADAAAIAAQDDAISTDFNTAASNVDLLSNDETASGVTFNILQQPSSGTLEASDNGIVTYTPNSNFSGEDSFIYEICSVECTDDCDEGTVSITVNQGVGSCDVPNTFTPNNDGANDTFIVPCLEIDRLNNKVQIFNRWGDIVFEQEDYRNNWDGTYNGNPLPPGVYFYCLFLDKNDSDPMQGYVTIVR